MNQDIKRLTIVCDSREERSGVPQSLRNIEGVTVETADLLSGDYAVGDQLGIERKTAVDFVNSILDGRLMSQAARLQSEFSKSLLILEGDVYNTRSIIKLESLDGALSYLALLSGISVLHTSNAARTAQLIYRCCLHSVFGLGYEVPLRVNKPKDLSIGRQFLLEGLPSVGPKSAQKLLSHFGTPGKVFSATEAELLAVKGLGPSAVRKITDTVHGD